MNVEQPPNINAQPDPAPLAERVVGDVETLRALSDPLRIRILEAMVQAHDASWTVKRIATALGVGPTKLYHHIKILEERELIRPAGQQLVRGIVETSYRIGQLQLRLDRQLLASGGADVQSATQQAITAVFDQAREDLERAMAAGIVRVDAEADSSRPLIVRRDLIRTTPERAAELRERLAALLDEYGTDSDGELTLGVLVSLHPLAGKPARATTRRTDR
jgi:DNA-binding transcriptional ArsR family regulator